MEQTAKMKLNKSKFRDYYDKYKHLIRFVIVGCINTGVDFLAFIFFYSIFGFEKLACQSLGYSLGMINSFIMNKLWTFESKGSRFETTNQFFKFLTVNAVSLGVSLLFLKLFAESCGMNIYASKILVTLIAQIINYTGYKLWVFNMKAVNA